MHRAALTGQTVYNEMQNRMRGTKWDTKNERDVMWCIGWMNLVEWDM